MGEAARWRAAAASLSLSLSRPPARPLSLSLSLTVVLMLPLAPATFGKCEGQLVSDCASSFKRKWAAGRLGERAGERRAAAATMTTAATELARRQPIRARSLARWPFARLCSPFACHLLATCLLVKSIKRASLVAIYLINSGRALGQSGQSAKYFPPDCGR